MIQVVLFVFIAVLAHVQSAWGQTCRTGLNYIASPTIYLGNCACIIQGTNDNYTCCQWNWKNESCPQRFKTTLGVDTLYYSDPYEHPFGYNVECGYRVMCVNDRCAADSIPCLNDTSKVWNSAACECQPKGQQADPQKCRFCRNKQKGDGVIGETPITWKTYAQIYECVQCHEENGRIVSAEGCEYKYQLEGSCEDNDECPEGEICPDSLRNPVACIATVGATVWMRDQRTGNTFKCEADGSCERAKQMVMNGECKNPYEQPPSSSPSGESSSGAEPSSSDSQPQSSDSEFCDMCDKLGRIVANTQSIMNSNLEIAEYTQQTMDNTTDIKNGLSDMAIDVSHIRTNTETTAGNTGTIASNTGAIVGSTNSIDNKLTTTNSLLNDIKNKNWQPHIEVNPEITVQGDTNIINVQGDTAKSGAAILDFLKGLFSDTSSNYNPQDTAGSGAEIGSYKDSLSSLFAKNDTIQNMSDSMGSAVQSMSVTYGQMRDSVNAITADSMAAWANKITRNGVLNGQGSNNCPSVLTRTWQLRIPVASHAFTVAVPSLGTWLCNPITILGGLTFWALARVILRMLVAILCMWWIYRTVLGVNGGDDED